MSNLKFVFFGTPRFAVTALDILLEHGFIPTHIVTRPDAPQGRGLTLTPPPTKVWGEKNGIPVLQPHKLDREFSDKLSVVGCQLFIVASYGKIIPESIFTIPKFGTLNIHPSLLPKLRGPSPIESAILEENETGVTIMKIAAGVDDGEILAKKSLPAWEPTNLPYFRDLEDLLARTGANLLADCIPLYLNGEIELATQVTSEATFSKKIKKEDALIDLSEDPVLNLRKIRAFEEWPRAYTYFDIRGKSTRVVISRASIESDKLVIEKVVPEGRKEMSWKEFSENFLKS
jgi:methionyl-tRNA formyltransferase